MLPGLPHEAGGFVPVGPYGRVRGVEHASGRSAT